ADVRRAAAGERAAVELLECAVRTKSGRYRDVRWQLAHAPSEVDDEVVLFAIGQDMTEELLLKEKTMQHEKLAAVGTLAAGLAHAASGACSSSRAKRPTRRPSSSSISRAASRR